MEDFFKFPRTPHLLNLGGTGVSDDDIVMDQQQARAFLNQATQPGNYLVAEEKIDGANLGVSLDKSTGNVVFQNRGKIVTSASHTQFAALEQFESEHSGELYDILSKDYILFGEWMYAKHSIYYTRLPARFIAFDIYDKTKKCFLSVARRDAMLADTTIPVIRRVQLPAGAVNVDTLRATLDNLRSDYYDGPVEGIYLRVDNESQNVARSKIVNSEFSQAITTHWTKQTLVKNKIRL